MTRYKRRIKKEMDVFEKSIDNNTASLIVHSKNIYYLNRKIEMIEKNITASIAMFQDVLIKAGIK